jgi:hypothetical protein
MNNRRPNAFGSTFAFFANAQTNAKKCKRATKQTHNDTTTKNEMDRQKKGLQLTGVLQKWGICAKFEHRNSNQHLC